MEESTILLSATLLCDCSATLNGGAVHSGTGSVAVLRECNFSANSADGVGGAACVEEAATLEISLCEFLGDATLKALSDDGTTAEQGGCLYARDANISIADSRFSSCAADGYGSAIYADSPRAPMWINRTIFENNTAGEDSRDAAAYLSAGKFELLECVVLGSIDNDGENKGAIYLGGAGTYARFTRCAFIENPRAVLLQCSPRIDLRSVCAVFGMETRRSSR